MCCAAVSVAALITAPIVHCFSITNALTMMTMATTTAVTISQLKRAAPTHPLTQQLQRLESMFDRVASQFSA